MSRRNRILTWLAGLLVLLGLAYASLPWVLGTVIRQIMLAQGMRDIQLQLDYPGWQALRLRALAFTVDAGAQQVQVHVPDVEIQYRIKGLVQGRVERIRVPLATLTVQAADHDKVSRQTKTSGQQTVMPLALLSGHWLTQLPLREFSLQRLNATWQTTPTTIYTLQLSGQFKHAQLAARGEIKVPQLTKPLPFSLTARQEGRASLVLSSVTDATTPLLTVSVTAVDVEHVPIQVSGELHTRLPALMPMLRPWLKQLDQLSGVSGELESQWQLRLKNSAWQLAGDARLRGLSGQWRDQAIPMSEVTAKYTADAKRATLQASMNTADKAIVLQADGVQQFSSGRGLAEIRLMPVIFKKEKLVMSQLFSTWPYPFDVDAGRASAAVQLRWDKIVTSTAQIHLEHIGGKYNNVVFSGVNGEMALNLDKGISTRKTARLQVAMLDVGFPVENIDARFTLASSPGKVIPIIKMQKVSATLLGGQAYSGPFDLDLNRDRNAFVVQLEHIDLAKIMQLEQQEGLEGSGLLDGQLPLSLTRAGVAMNKGRLSVRKPGGVIRYTPTPKVLNLAQSNPSVSMIVDALRNFHYKVMQVQSDYNAKGDLHLQVHIEGSNPDWQAGKQVHLNLNLQENIPVLLRSLQLGGEISERVRQHYQTAPQ